MPRTFNRILAAAGLLALFLGGCDTKTENAIENIAVENAVENDIATENFTVDANASENAVDAGVEDGNLIVPPFTDPQPPATDTGPDDEAEAGLGAFKELGDMEVDNWYTVEFFVAPDKPGLADESEGIALTAPTAIYVAPAMRVTLRPDPSFEIRAKSEAVVMTGRDRDASWQWDVKPLTGGERTLYATVEVLKRNPDGTLTRNPDGSFVASESKTRRVDVRVKVGTWKGFLTAIQNASTLGDVLGTLFSSWQKTLLALAALIAAASGVWLAVRNWGKAKQEG